ncbi:MAG: BON domain-containing protein [Chloroflexi bacterium]|nr:BON domain-containing protein [Chloroflexota bacterium]MDA8187385.1 BON domain-containing protein [Dehalococcoidales bacterium]
MQRSARILLPSNYVRSRIDLAQEVIEAITGDDRINWGESDVRVSSRDATIVLAGKVSRLADKRRVENDALHVKGVKSIENNLSIVVKPSRSDRQIRQHVVDALEQDRWIDQTRIKVSVQRGIVRLEGEVESLLRKRLAGAAAWWVAGTQDVINDLQVLYPEPDGDDQITDACETALEKDPFVDESEVLVRTRHGTVTLLGSVCSEGERQMAEDDCWYILGVKDVINKLAVYPGGGMERPAL